MPKFIQVVEVGPRDGLQNEVVALSVADRLEMIHRLADSGVKRIEAGAFVSPKWVPQMQGSKELIQQLAREKFPKGVRFSALVPNPKGMELALETPIREVAVFGACSEGFSRHNINCTIDESFERFREVIALARKRKIQVRGYLSTAFGCPYDGHVPEKRVVELVSRLLKMGVYEVSVGDTIGVATPKQVHSMLKKLKRRVPIKKIAMHLHDTRGTALANVLASLEEGVTVFDSSVGGIGGCPYAKGASGNVATDDLVYMLQGMGLKTGIDLAKLITIKPFLEGKMGRTLNSRVAGAGLPLPNTLTGL